MTRNSTEVWVLAFLSAALIAARVYPEFAPNLHNDSFQYLSMAKNTLAGLYAHTSLVHFDAERSFGVIPAPVVTFPAGYPLAIALVSRTGLSLQSAALLISAASTVACVPLLAWIAERLGLSRALRNILLAIFVLNAAVVDYAASALTEAPFTFLAVLGVALLVAARRFGQTRYWIAAGFVFGASYFVRYAGLFLVAGLAIVAIRHVIAGERSVGKGYVLACAIAGTLVLAGMARNIMLLGSWRGGNEKIISNSLLSVLVETARAVYGVFLGPGSALHGGTFIPRALCAVLFVTGMAWMTWRYLQQRRTLDTPRPAGNGLGSDLLLLVVTYSGCMFYAGLTTVISYDARMFVPVAPLIILLLGLALHAFLANGPRANTSRLPKFALLASFGVYLFLNMLVFRQPIAASAAAVSKHMDWAPGNEKPARLAVLELTGERGVVLANNGQAVGYVLGLRTVSMVGPRFSAVEWNETTTRETALRFNAAAVVISVPTGGALDDVPSSFVHQLAQGYVPSWLKLVYRSDAVLVYSPRSAAD